MKVSSSKVVIGTAILSLIAAVICGMYIFQGAMKRERLPVLGQIKPFIFTDIVGRSFDSQTLYRNVWIAGVVSAPCDGGCDKVLTNMASLSRTFEQIPALKLVTVTAQPEKDAPQVLAKLSDRYVKGKDNWFFLTGPRTEIERFYGEQLKVVLDAPQGRYSPTLVLIDRSGYVRGYYDGTLTANVNKLFLDASQLLKERF